MTEDRQEWSSCPVAQLIPMDSEVPLPPPRRIRHRSPRAAQSPAGSVASAFRPSRRQSRFDDLSSQPSSDPALFSSDDIPASGLENYNAPVAGTGRKRRYRGTWWGEQVIDPKRKRADFKEKRHLDSGVWMGSDESGVDSLLSSEDAPAWGEDLLKTAVACSKNSKGPSSLSNQVSASQSVLPLPIVKAPNEPDGHRIARATVHDCLEKGEEDVDLGNLNLRTIPPGLLRPLCHLTKLPAVREAPISEDAYTSLQPFLKIYLPGNSLMFLHNELFELKELRVLSVRNNKLREVSPMIRHLTSLEVLNIAVNQLTYLPWELLQLVRCGELKHLTANPNPFPTIEQAEITTWHRKPQMEESAATNSVCFDEYEETPADAWQALHVATGPVIRLDMEGRRIDSSSIPASMVSHANAPSLREVALRAVSKLSDVEHITDDELADFPALVIPLMHQVRKIRAAGGQRCSVCQADYVLPRTEWLEWWDCIPHENGMKRPRASGEKLRPLPFKRFGCSWACVPQL